MTQTLKHLSLPLIQTGWNDTICNDSEGNTLTLMLNGHKGLEAVQEATRMFAGSPILLEALQEIASACQEIAASPNSEAIMGKGWIAAHEKLGAYALAMLSRAGF